MSQDHLFTTDLSITTLIRVTAFAPRSQKHSTSGWSATGGTFQAQVRRFLANGQRPSEDFATPARASRTARARAARLARLLTAYRRGLRSTGHEQADMACWPALSWNSIPFNRDAMVDSDFCQPGLSLANVIQLRRRQSVHALMMSDPVFNDGLPRGHSSGRLSQRAPIETYRLSARVAQHDRAQVNQWRRKLIATLHQSGVGTIWELAAMPASQEVCP